MRRARTSLAMCSGVSRIELLEQISDSQGCRPFPQVLARNRGTGYRQLATGKCGRAAILLSGPVDDRVVALLSTARPMSRALFKFRGGTGFTYDFPVSFGFTDRSKGEWASL